MSLLRVIGSSDARDNAGSNITKMGDARRKVVRDVIARALASGRSVESAARALARRAASTKDKDRDWQRVARTEMTESLARGALDLIRTVHGDDAKVWRETNDCCDECADAFGRNRHRHFRAGDVPADLVGAVHPNCKCGPWQTNAQPLLKAQSDPVGIIKRDMELGKPSYSISTGFGKWEGLFSISGKAAIRHILTRIPFVVVEKCHGYWLLRHGHGKPKIQDLILLDPRGVGGVEYHHANPFDADHQRQARMVTLKTWDGYIESMMKIVPAVVSMPEYWDPYKGGLKHLSDFMGYKTLTDWYLILPRKTLPANAIILEEPLGAYTVRQAVTKITRMLARADDLRKDQ